MGELGGVMKVGMKFGDLLGCTGKTTEITVHEGNIAVKVKCNISEYFCRLYLLKKARLTLLLYYKIAVITSAFFFYTR